MLARQDSLEYFSELRVPGLCAQQARARPPGQNLQETPPHFERKPGTLQAGIHEAPGVLGGFAYEPLIDHGRQVSQVQPDAVCG